MSPHKKFGRPAVFEVEDDRPGGAVRTITMTREGGALEGMYASVSSRDELRLQPYETHRREIISSGVRAWFGLAFFWASICMILSTFVL
jgi:hypothetical protein